VSDGEAFLIELRHLAYISYVLFLSVSVCTVLYKLSHTLEYVLECGYCIGPTSFYIMPFHCVQAEYEEMKCNTLIIFLSVKSNILHNW